MEIKIRPIGIPSETPFVNDELGRQVEIKNLTDLLVNIETPLVFAIDAKWGSGKTTFIKMWQADLSNQEIYSLYFNAWETDFAEDPLIAFLGELNSSINHYLEKDTGKKKLWEKAKKIGGHIAKRSIPVAVKLGTAGIIDTDQLLEKEISGLSQKLADDAVNSYNKTKSLIDEFKKNLKEVFKSSKEPKQPIFIFIDELDRCRPTYALELLERIKHILDIENLIFVLSLDKSQLCNSIRAVYGQDLDSVAYLRRFIDIEYSLRAPNRKNYIASIYKKFGLETFFESRKGYRDFSYEKESLLKIFNILADGFMLSLREIEQYFSRIYLVILSTKINIHLYTPILVVMTFLKEKNSKLYLEFIDPLKNGDEVIRYFREVMQDHERIKVHHFALLEGFVIGAKKNRHEEINSEIFKEHIKISENEISSQDDRTYSDRVIRIAKEPIDWRSGIILDDLVKRFEMAEQFNLNQEEAS
jgi:hypothetical protein